MSKAANTKKEHEEVIEALYQSHFGEDAEKIEQIPISGSDRRYLRLTNKNGNTVIGTTNTDKNENNTFIYFTRIFKKHNLPVPEIFAVSKDKKTYLQQDLGNQSLFQIVEEEGHTERVKALFKKAISNLAKFHWEAGREIDYSMCFASKAFDRKAVFADLLYFKYYFVDLLKLQYDKTQLLDELEDWSKSLAAQKPQTFMYRDFQSRNIIVNNEEVYFIDYQGGMLGLPQYDIASLLWQAKAKLPDEWKNELVNHYFTTLKQLPEVVNFDETVFRKVYLDCVLLRILQTLGAYGFRGILERKPHFLSSISPALEQLQNYLNTWSHLPVHNELRKVLTQLIKPEIKARFHKNDGKIIAQKNNLEVNIYSFSYKKGLPADKQGHGGGFVFDCRGILNPGRIDEYKSLTGKDKAVAQYLEDNTEMPAFLENVFGTIDISVGDYIARGFDALTITFGCTGGQHRSVYAAERTKQHLLEKYNIKVNLLHIEQDAPDTERMK